jgi:V/A-type H+/Na+-transporting ATPase subunit D
MAIALNKTTLKQQRDQAKTFKQFLPSLDLKRQQLLVALKQSRAVLQGVDSQIDSLQQNLEPLYPLLGSSTIATLNVSGLIRVRSIRIENENMVGTKLPVIREIDFRIAEYSTLATPYWVDHLIQSLQRMAQLRIEHQVALRRVELLELAARRITQRVNLFEKVLIPQAEDNIRRIAIYLSDQERAAVVRSKISKGKQASASGSHR